MSRVEGKRHAFIVEGGAYPVEVAVERLLYFCGTISKLVWYETPFRDRVYYSYDRPVRSNYTTKTWTGTLEVLMAEDVTSDIIPSYYQLNP